MNKNLELLIKVPEKFVGELFANGLAESCRAASWKLYSLVKMMK